MGGGVGNMGEIFNVLEEKKVIGFPEKYIFLILKTAKKIFHQNNY